MGLVPNGLFVSIAIAYALGAVRIIRFGALVQQANAIESLSNVDVLCLDKTGTLTANRLSVEEIVPLAGSEDGPPGGPGSRRRERRRPQQDRRGDRRRLPGRDPAAPGRRAVLLGPQVERGRVRGRRRESRDPAASWPWAPRSSCARSWRSAPTGSPPGGPISASGWRTDAGAGCAFSSWPAIPTRACLVGEGDAAELPPGMTVLGLVVLRDELRPDAEATLARFAAAGVMPKVISGDDPETVAALARQAGLGRDLRFVSGPELEALDDATLGAVAAETTVFGRITPAQKERLVDALRARGSYVAMIGDGVNDVLSLKKANLGIAMQSGSQATRGVADIVLTDDSFASLAPAVEEGQRILNGMQDILRLFLTRIVTVGLLIVTSLVVGLFPIDLRNASALTLFTVGIPTALLAVWAQPGQRPHDSLGRTLARFVVPAAILSSLAGLAVLYGTLFLRLSPDGPFGAIRPNDPVAYDAAVLVAQSALTSFLVLAGLVLVVFVEPPIERLAVIEPRTPDRRPTLLAVGLGIAYLVLVSVPGGRAIFSLRPLGLAEILIVGLAVAAWAVLLFAAWRHRVVERFLGV